MNDLFRAEAAEFQQQRLYGSIVLARGWPSAVLTGLFGTIALALVVCFFSFGMTRKESVVGVIRPDKGVIRVAAGQGGVLLESRVADGQPVKQGEVLFVLSNERVSDAGDTQSTISGSLQTRISRLQGEVDQQHRQTEAQQRTVRTKLAQLRDEIAQLGGEIGLQARRLELARKAAKRFADLQKERFVSETAAQDKEAEVLDQEARLRALQRSRLALQRELTGLEADEGELPLRADRESSGLARNIDEVKQDLAESEARRKTVVRAPQSGRLASVHVEVGQAVDANQTLADLLPLGSTMEAELYAPTRAVGFAQIGGSVLLRYDAYPYEKFGQHRGTVRDISRNAVAASELKLHGGASGGTGTEPMYRIRVRLDEPTVRAFGQEHALKPGMQLEASLMLEHRKLYEWVLEPLYSVTGRL